MHWEHLHVQLVPLVVPLVLLLQFLLHGKISFLSLIRSSISDFFVDPDLVPLDSRYLVPFAQFVPQTLTVSLVELPQQRVLQDRTLQQVHQLHQLV